MGRGAGNGSASVVGNHHHHLGGQVLLLGLHHDLVGEVEHCELELVAAEWQVCDLDSSRASDLDVFGGELRLGSSRGPRLGESLEHV